MKTGLDIGADPASLAAVLARGPAADDQAADREAHAEHGRTSALRRAAAEAEGADAVSLINTLRAMAPRPDGSGEPWLGGADGRAVGPGDPRRRARRRSRRSPRASTIPVVGMGGIQTADHARQFLDAGATLVAVGTESFRDPPPGSASPRELARDSRKEREHRVGVTPLSTIPVQKNRCKCSQTSLDQFEKHSTSRSRSR